jgi:hypothetical protein
MQWSLYSQDTADAALRLAGCLRENRGAGDPADTRARRVGREFDRMDTNVTREEKPSHRRAESPHCAVAGLDDRTARAVTSLFAIEQTHLSEFDNE